MVVSIPNHYTPSLSELDLTMVHAIPPGGNWKDIPESVPSKRLEQIRKNYAAGNGSRSTYYGRLHPDAPSYTISTCFNRPGNGCYIHYRANEHRMISQREAARLQSFPDSFIFEGSRTSINKQIGNALPPLLSYQIASHLGDPGCFIDLFCGAGGLSLGFVWAGWKPIVANDIDPKFLLTYTKNIHNEGILGDIRENNISEQIIAISKKPPDQRRLFVLGGPPCQGFSTAGNRRSMNDQRNQLFINYKNILAALQPDGFIFENVPGILNIERGKVFQMIKHEFSLQGYKTDFWKLKAEEYAVPQRRTRVFIIGFKSGNPSVVPPPVTSFLKNQIPIPQFPLVFTVSEALDDLPSISPGQDGSELDYKSPPSNSYQKFLRGIIKPHELLIHLKKQNA